MQARPRNSVPPRSAAGESGAGARKRGRPASPCSAAYARCSGISVATCAAASTQRAAATSAQAARASACVPAPRARRALESANETYGVRHSTRSTPPEPLRRSRERRAPCSRTQHASPKSLRRLRRLQRAAPRLNHGCDARAAPPRQAHTRARLRGQRACALRRATLPGQKPSATPHLATRLRRTAGALPTRRRTPRVVCRSRAARRGEACRFWVRAHRFARTAAQRYRRCRVLRPCSAATARVATATRLKLRRSASAGGDAA